MDVIAQREFGIAYIILDSIFILALLALLFFTKRRLTLLWAAIGGVLPFDSTGIDFAMTSLFTVIFVEQWMSARCHIPAFLGLGAAAISLAILGPDNFILPAMIAICVMLVALRGKLAKEVAE